MMEILAMGALVALMGAGMLLIWAVLFFPVACFLAWPVMLTLGDFHHWFSAVPPFGFWEIMVALWALSIVAGILKPSTGNVQTSSD